MFDRQALIELIQRDALKFGEFTLASGATSSYYLDCRKVTLQSAGAALIGQGILEHLEGKLPDAVGGMAIGAASFAVALSAVGKIAPPERRSFMLGLVSAIGSLGQFVLVPVANWHLERNDWQDTAVLLAVVLIAIVVVAPGIMSTRLRSLETGAGPTEPERPLRQELRRARHSRSYLMLNAAFFVCGFHVTYIGIFLPGYAEDSGLSTGTASTALALIGLFNVFGSLTAGVLGQRMAFTHVLAGIYGLRAVVIAVYLLVPITATSTIVFGAAIGLLWLATVPMTSAIVTQQFGPAHAGALFGIVFLSHQLGSFLGAWMGGELVDATDSYAAMWWISVALGVFAMAMHLMIDESPVPEPPPGGAGLGVVPAGAAALFLVAGASSIHTAATVDPSSASAAATTGEAEAPADEHTDMLRRLGYCPLGGLHLD